MAHGKKRDPIPKHFQSVQEAAEFWDSHELINLWLTEKMSEAAQGK